MRSVLEGPTQGGEEPTTLLLRDAECRVAPVQDGALRADAAFAQHLALLWVQRAQQPILTRLRGFTGRHTGLVYRVAGAQEGCRGTVHSRPSSDPRQGKGAGRLRASSIPQQTVQRDSVSSPLSSRLGVSTYILLKHSHVYSSTY